MAQMKRFPLVSLVALGFAMPALAQTPAQPATGPQAAESGKADVVVITANKREESIQDVPVAVTAVTAEAKTELGIVSVTDLTNVTPGLSYTAGNERVTLRGIGRLTNNFGADPGVANYNDGVYTAFATLAGKDPILIDRVEVLRGPQGTLYGRNSIGGAINTVSKHPTDTFQADVEIAAGNFGERKFAAAVSGPITDWLRYRVAGWDEKRDGVNPNLGFGGKESWAFDQYYYEGQLEGDIGDRFKWWVKAVDIGYDYAGPPGGRVSTFSAAPYLPFIASNPLNTRTGFMGSLSPNGTYAFSGDPSVISYTQDGHTTQNPFYNGIRAYNSSEALTAHLPQYDEYEAQATYSAGPFDIKYLGGYTFYKYKLTNDLDGDPVRSLTYNAVTAATLPTGLAGDPCPQYNIGLPVGAYANASCVLASAPRTIYPNVQNEYIESRSFFSNELNLISTWSGPLQLIGGLYQYQENSDQPVTSYMREDPTMATYYNPGTNSMVANPQHIRDFTRNRSIQNSYGAYVQGDYAINDQWKATVGLRYSYDLKNFQEDARYVCYLICGYQYGAVVPALAYLPAINVSGSSLTGASPNYTGALGNGLIQPGVTSATLANPSGVTFTADGTAHRTLGDDWSAVTGTAGLQWTPTTDTLVYAKYSRGYKSGGFNATAMSPEPETNAEHVDSYEGGWKQTWDAIHLVTDAALFYYKYTDAQAPVSVVTNPGVPGSSAYTAFLNLPEVHTTGFELESTWTPIEDLRIGFNYSFLNAEIADAPVLRDSSRASTDPLRDRSVVGNKLPSSPRNKVAINAVYTFNFEDGSTLRPTVSWYWRDKFYASIFNNPNEQTPDFQQTDARLLWNSADGHYTVIGYVRNLFDEEGYDLVSANGYRVADAGRYQTITFTPPRMYGVEFQFHFK
jgi:iron complex outermembrane receptor protein